MNQKEDCMGTVAKNLWDELDQEFLQQHQRKEKAFWLTYMGIEEKEEELVEAEKALNSFKQDPSKLEACREALSKADPGSDEATVLQGWVRFFERNVIQNSEAQELQDKMIAMEAEINKVKRGHDAGYKDPNTGKHVSKFSGSLQLMLRTHPDEAYRKAAYEGMMDIEDFVLNETCYIELIKLRNRFARVLGFEDFMAYKCRFAEDLSKEETFSLLEEAVDGIKDHWMKNLEGYRREHGDRVLDAWNFGYLTTGDLSKELDPYFPFAQAMGQWTRSFRALNIDYSEAELNLDLLERKGKYENGFMHAPGLTMKRDGQWQPAVINFTANADPKQVGSGLDALRTLFHEGGHAAHFANVKMPSPVFSHEFPPTSMAVAETQSMFLDSLIEDADWRVCYAKNAQGESIPMELIEKNIRLGQPLKPLMVGSLGVVSLFEREVYSLPEAELTPKRLKDLAREVECRVFGMARGRPLLTVPHLLAFDCACCYHGYLFAEMAVAQTRDFFIKRDGYLCNNPKIGPDLAKHYWKPGNSRSFHQLVQDLTGEKVSSTALVHNAIKSVDEALQEARDQVKNLRPAPEELPNLNAKIRAVHGAEVISHNEQGEDLLVQGFANWVTKQ